MEDHVNSFSKVLQRGSALSSGLCASTCGTSTVSHCDLLRARHRGPSSTWRLWLQRREVRRQGAFLNKQSAAATAVQSLQIFKQLMRHDHTTTLTIVEYETPKQIKQQMTHSYTTGLKTVVFTASTARDSDIQATLHFHAMCRTDHTYFLSEACSRNTQAWAERTLQLHTDKRPANIQRATGTEQAGNTYQNNSSQLSYLHSNTGLPDTATESAHGSSSSQEQPV